VEPSTTPWRVLEDPPDGARKRDGTDVPASDATTRVPRSALITGGAAVLLAVGAFFLAFGAGSGGSITVEGGAPLDSALPATSAGGGTVASASARLVVVEIVGAIERPGVFRLPADSRVGDLVTAAGGYGPRVDAGRAGRELNLAAALKDGDQIRVPSRDDAATASSGPADPGGHGAGVPTAGPIDLNRATEAELDTLPGIGPVTAAKILASREEQPFATVQELRTRKLVGEKTFTSLKDLITVS
jgi:competence protein ComEA